MKVIASILALSSATTCPNAAWEYDSVNSVCIPAANSDFAFTCNSDGTLSIDFKLEHLYSNVANSFLTEAQTALTDDGVVGPTNDVYTFESTAMTFSQATADKIVGTFDLAGQLYTRDVTTESGDSVTMEISDPITTTITCEYSSTIATSTELEITASPTFNSPTAGSFNLADLMTATLSFNGSPQTSFALGDQVDVAITEPTAFLASAEVKLVGCTVYEDVNTLSRPIEIIKTASCGISVLSATATDEYNFSFSAFQYSTTPGQDVSLQCTYQICLTDGSGVLELSTCFDSVDAKKAEAQGDTATYTCL